MSLTLPTPDAGADLGSLRVDRNIQALSLEAQAALLPYALGFFAIGLPIFVWVATYASNAPWALTTLAAFAINWGAFYALVSAVRRDEALAEDVARRTRMTIMAGLLWSATIAQISVFALSAGPAREPLLMLATGLAVVCMVFTAPCLPVLLVVGSTAAAAPLAALLIFADTREAGGLAWGAIALAAALALVLNRMMVRQFGLTYAHQQLTATNARSLAETERLAKSKSDLLATLSHEIRNGLTGVVHVLAAAAGAGGRAAPSREQLNAALEAARDLTSALDATLDSEHAEAGRLAIRIAPFDAAKLASDLVLLNRPQAAAKSLEMSVHVEPEIAEAATGAAVGDASRARQVLSHLIANAVKYTLRGRIEVRVRKLSADRIRIEIADTGPGLAPDELAQAFTPFTRIQRTSAGSSGAGLGLSLAAKLAGMMDGQVSVDSAPGVGSCFSLDLPYDAKAVADPDQSADVVSPSSRRVLMIEADALQAAMTRASLEQLGHQVVHAQRAARIAELLKVCDVELVLVGDGGPDVASGEVVAQVRAIAPGARIVAVIEGDPTEAGECIAAGAAEVLRRPVTVASLARVLTAAGRPAPLKVVKAVA
ncbi:MAG: hybrid sensor histidine kinase/receiver protein [Caulobacteraceae bacterium]|nr:hybrid sensor histidine kinase/receiver protein [Caulobacteraceae bacterium]